MNASPLAIALGLFGVGLFVLALLRTLERWQRLRDFRDMGIDADPDPRIHRPGSVADFRGQLSRSRFP